MASRSHVCALCPGSPAVPRLPARRRHARIAHSALARGRPDWRRHPLPQSAHPLARRGALGLRGTPPLPRGCRGEAAPWLLALVACPGCLPWLLAQGRRPHRLRPRRCRGLRCVHPGCQGWLRAVRTADPLVSTPRGWPLLPLSILSPSCPKAAHAPAPLHPCCLPRTDCDAGAARAPYPWRRAHRMRVGRYCRLLPLYHHALGI